MVRTVGLERAYACVTQDPGAGVVTGNGFADSFDGRSFTWHVATPTGVSRTSTNSSDMSDSGGSLYG